MDICYEFRGRGSGCGRYRTLLLELSEDGKIQLVSPARVVRSGSGWVGEECYSVEDLRRVVAEVRIAVTASCKHLCSIRFFTREASVIVKIWRWLEVYEHLCPSMLSRFEFALPPALEL